MCTLVMDYMSHASTYENYLYIDILITLFDATIVGSSGHSRQSTRAKRLCVCTSVGYNRNKQHTYCMTYIYMCSKQK